MNLRELKDYIKHFETQIALPFYGSFRLVRFPRDRRSERITEPWSAAIETGTTTFLTVYITGKKNKAGEPLFVAVVVYPTHPDPIRELWRGAEKYREFVEAQRAA